jgi:Ca2+/Na+ antiporter
VTTTAPISPKPRRRWVQFSLRRLLVVVLLVCGVFGLVAQFGPLNVLVFVLLSAVVVGVAMSRRKRTMLEGKGTAERIRQQQVEYERRGGWARPFINGVFFLSIALASVIGALWYDGLHDVGEYGGVFQFVAASLISYLLLCVAVICLTVTLLNFSKLPRTQRILGTLPIVLTGLVFLLMAILK